MEQPEKTGRQLDSPPAALRAANPLRWLVVFGPGAIMASLTIGTGELIFSSRGGAIFGYRILFLFLLICLLKWTLVFSTARHMVASGVHPFYRWLDLPIGPRGWLPAVMFVFAMLCIPIWVSFHATVVGELLASVTGTRQILGSGANFIWALTALTVILWLAWSKGYVALEKAQLLVVAVMLVVVALAVLLLQPNWLQVLAGMIVPQPLELPDWILHSSQPALQEIAHRPVWVEASLYVGVIGGASYDYLAYTSFLRDKRWGLAGITRQADPRQLTPQQRSIVKEWMRAPLMDCTISFAIVFVFSAVFVVSGWMVLAPNRQLPADGNFLEHQAQFVTQLHPALYPLYVVGALLAMVGTLYGTLEIAPAVLRESVRLIRIQGKPWDWRRLALGWCGVGAGSILLTNLLLGWLAGAESVVPLSALLIPANLFTGVFSCGLVCLLNPWMDRRLPSEMRPGHWSTFLNWAGAGLFLFLGVKGYWDFGGWAALMILLLTLFAGCAIAWCLRARVVS